MNKITSDHLITQLGFLPLVMEADFLADAHLDHLEGQVGKAKIVGFVAPRGWSTRVILDTKDHPTIPFYYIYTYADKFGEDVKSAISKIVKEEAEKAEAERLRLEAEKLRLAEEEAKLTPEQKQRRQQILTLKMELHVLCGRVGLKPFGSTDNWYGIEEAIKQRIINTEKKLKDLEKVS